MKNYEKAYHSENSKKRNSKGRFSPPVGELSKVSSAKKGVFLERYLLEDTNFREKLLR